MNPSPIHEFPVSVNCPKDFRPYKVWVREATAENAHLLQVNGCDNYSGDARCQACCASVYRKVTQDR